MSTSCIYRPNSLTPAEEYKKILNVTFLIFGIVALILFAPIDLVAADPLESLKSIFKQEASDHAFPVIIMWLLIAGIVASVIMSRWLPFIFAIIGCVVIGVAPEVSDAFTSTNIKPAAGW